MTLPDDSAIQNEPHRINERLAVVTLSMTSAIMNSLSASPNYELVPIPDALGADDFGDALPNRQFLTRLRDTFGIEAVLYVRLSGYGRLNKKWTTGVIASGSAEAVGEGGLVWLAVGNAPLALAVMLEEGIRDTLMAVGGVSAFNAGYSPVTLDAVLLGTADGKELSSYTAFATADSKAIERLPKEEQSKTEVRLQVTGEKAILDLVEHLDKTAEEELRSMRETPTPTHRTI
jgi:hypothetical protein